jgi:hypothetical protein
MRSRNLIILAAVAIALGAFIFFIERHQPTSDERLERADRVFPKLDGKTIVAVELETSSGPVRLAKAMDEWRLVEPMDYPADPTAIRSIVDSIANLDVERILPIGEVEFGDYGLDDPALGVVLVDSEGQRFSLAVGEETPLGSNRAVRRGTDEEIILSSGFFVANLDKDVDQWRSRDVVDLAEHDLASIEISTPDDRILAVQEDGRWQLHAPLTDLADRNQMQSLVSELNTLRVSEFLSIDADSSELGLDPPAFRVVMVREDDQDPLVLEMSASDERESAAPVVCRRNGVDVFTVPASITIRLSKAPVLWRSDKVWPFSSWDVSRVEITNATGEVVLKDADGLWQLDDGGEAESAEVRRRLNALADLVVREHDLVLPPTEVLGSVILVLDSDNGAEGLTYTFYAPMEEGGHAAVTVSVRANVMGVDAVTVETIVGNLEKLHPMDEEPLLDGDT